MPSLVGETSRRLIVFVAVAALGLGACIIGPKQDDPAPTSLSADTGTNEFDSTAGGGDGSLANDSGEKTSDTATAPMGDSGTQTMDGCDKSDADASDAICVDADARDGDAAGDASDAVSDSSDALGGG